MVDQGSHDAEAAASFGIAVEAPAAAVADLDDKVRIVERGAQPHRAFLTAIRVLDRIAGRFTDGKQHIVDASSVEPALFEKNP